MTIKITQYRWSGKWGPFKIKSDCEECDITTGIINSMMEKEFKDKDIEFEVKPWLDNWPHCLAKKSWHPPIVMVEDKKYHQFSKKDPLIKRQEFADFILAKLKE